MPPPASPFPDAHVARLPKGTADKKCGILVARAMQYLLVRVLFHGAPVANVKVRFACIDGIDDASPEKMDPELVTNDEGVACFPRLVVAGMYGCAVERQPETVVPTVARLDGPYPVVLPIGRPLVDIHDIDEFVYRPG
jgi:hypothetical protein